MIETPVKAPPPSGPPDAPPPDARARVMDPPPDPGGRHEFSCVSCGAPLHGDQAACLSCGAMVDQDAGGVGIRRAALGSVTALLVLSGAMGAAVAGLPHGKKVAKPKDGQAIGKNPLPPATQEADPGDDTTSLPGADSPSDPPALDSPKPPNADGVPSTADTGGSPGTSGGGGGGTPADDTDDGDDDTGGDKKQENPGNKEPSWVKSGASPRTEGATVWDGGQSASTNALYRAIDGDRSTAFQMNRIPLGIVLSDEGFIKSVGLISRDSDYFVEVYTSNADEPPGELADWDRSDRSNHANAIQELTLESDARDAKHLLILFNTTVSLSEIKLIQE